jgi:membrane associated rhomboid family serine protease
MPLCVMQRRCIVFLRILRRQPGIAVASSLSSSSMMLSSLSSINFDSRKTTSDAIGRRSSRDFWDPSRRATDVLLLLNAACFLLQWLSRGALTYWGCKMNNLILDQGQLWRIFTPTFLHSSLIHLAVNSYALHSLGPQVESLAGHKRLIVVFLGSALVGTLASVFLTPQPSLGASGAIFGLGASLGLFYWRHREELGERSEVMLRQLSITAAVNLVYSLAVKNIDNWGHLGGAVGGLVISYLLGPRLIAVAPPQQMELPTSSAKKVSKGPSLKKRPRRQFIDSPPLPLLASDATYSLLSSSPHQMSDRKADQGHYRSRPADPPT